MNNVCKIALERGNSMRRSPQREAGLEQGWTWQKALWLQQGLKMTVLHVVLKIFESGYTGDLRAVERFGCHL